MDVFTMRCFVSVADNQNLTKAAREMFISQPAMTTKMNALEAELGAKLLERGRQTHLTGTGEMVFRAFQRIIDEYDSLLDDISKAEAETRGTVRFGFHGPLDWAGLPRMIADFRQQNPYVEIDIVIDDWGSILEKLQAGNLDLVIIEQSEIEGLSNVMAATLFEERVCIVAPYDNPLSRKELVSIDDIRNETVLLPSLEIAPRFLHRMDDSFKRAGFKVKRAGQGNHYEATLTLAKAGMGVACIPLSFWNPSQNVRRMPFKDLGVHLCYQLAWMRDKSNAAISSFADYLLNQDWPHDEMV